MESQSVVSGFAKGVGSHKVNVYECPKHKCGRHNFRFTIKSNDINQVMINEINSLLSFNYPDFDFTYLSQKDILAYSLQGWNALICELEFNFDTKEIFRLNPYQEILPWYLDKNLGKLNTSIYYSEPEK
jgi:hypothetical protein